MNTLQGKKTYLVAALALVYAVLGLILGYLTPEQAVPIVFGALGGAALRHGMNN